MLERNVSAKVAAGYKRAAISDVTALGRPMLGCVGELLGAAPRQAAAPLSRWPDVVD